MEINSLRETYPDHWQLATAIRALSMDAVQNAKSGHPGMPLGMADVATVLFSKHLKFDVTSPTWLDRDRFILSAGHGSMLLYSLLYLVGYSDITIDDIKNFRQVHSKTAGHPEYRFLDGIETTTGPLGQGLANAVGFAIAERHLRSNWGKHIFNHHTYALVGDGCLMEGISQEAITLAGKQRLNKLILLWDNNDITIDGSVSQSCITDQKNRFLASNWNVIECDGHNPEEIDKAITNAKRSKFPTLISCKTKIGYGSPSKEGTASSHGAPLGDDEIKKIRKIYRWSHEEFYIPKNIKNRWEKIGNRGNKERTIWDQKFNELPNSKKNQISRIFNNSLPQNFDKSFVSLKKHYSETKPSIATRKSSELALELINEILPETIGGSADLTGSNNTLTDGLGIMDDQYPLGRYIYYGIREHGMAGVMNGMALHGGIIPYGGTFMAFTDYARGAIRLSALMAIKVIYVMTHDSIGLGEDGPTHQPVEHLAMLRATPNINVFRPADTVETIECWQLALTTQNTPSVLALSRQNLPTVRESHMSKNLVSRGAYILREASSKCKVILLASGSEVSIAIEAQKKLENEGFPTRVVSFPSWKHFEMQDLSYRKKVLPGGPVRIAIEASVKFGWEKWLLGERGHEKKSCFIGMAGFGASGPAKDLFKHYKITAENIIKSAKQLMRTD